MKGFPAKGSQHENLIRFFFVSKQTPLSFEILFRKFGRQAALKLSSSLFEGPGGGVSTPGQQSGISRRRSSSLFQCKSRRRVRALCKTVHLKSCGLNTLRILILGMG